MKANILYVDDELDNLTVFKIAFRRFYNVFTASSAAEGFSLLKDNDIQVVVTDQRMPEMTGVEFLSRIPQEPYIARIILTAYTESQAIIDAINKGNIYRYINKPWKLEDLKQTLDNAIEHQRLNQDNKQLVKDLQASNTQLEEANEELLRVNHQLYQLDQAKSEFLNIISHEIKTPLNGIVGLTRLLSSQINEDEYKDFFDALKVSVDRLDEFAKNAIFLTQLETQSYKVTAENHALSELMESAISTLKTKIEEKNLDVVRQCTPKNQHLFTDGILVQKCLAVVLDNAVRYSDEDSSIYLTANCTSTTAQIEVNDNGPGFSEQAIERLFKYFGIGESHYDQHVGLGLSLVKMATTALHGSVEVTNDKSKGASVLLTFPLSVANQH